MTSLTAPTPVERLANSRKAIVRHMSRDQLAHDEEAGAGESDAEDQASFGDGGTWGILKHAVGSWLASPCERRISSGSSSHRQIR